MIGINQGEYCGSFHYELVLACLGLPFQVFSDEDIARPGFGEGFRVMIFAGGHVTESETALGGETGRRRLRDLVASGCTYVGICAGSYLALSGDEVPGALGLAEHKLLSSQEETSFRGFVPVDWSGHDGRRFPMWVHNGPLYSEVNGEVLARFAGQGATDSSGELSGESEPWDRPAVVKSPYGEGQCILFTPHPEYGELGPWKWSERTSAWMERHFPEQLAAHPNLVPMGAAREACVDWARAEGFVDQAHSPQWQTLKELLEDAIGEG